ncbi:unnamed protein product [Lactuca virosa]|uniref:Prolamin-like domain-containing protein n=1 Tax=Lactuca virosa TaxID=75947 RepID=A0AAU9LN76_9ASTR|nr:unnamed protein product [Lactuca virosa]
MANSFQLIFLTLLISTTSMLVDTRPFIPIGAPSPTLLEELATGEDIDSTGCWESLFELQSCSGEIILFFLNGETYLGMGCCKAIEKIEKKCWPSSLGSLGFTNEEGDILRGYCDTSDDNDDVPTTTPPPHSANITNSTSTECNNGGF